MLDAFIIDRIRREREDTEPVRTPAHAELPSRKVEQHHPPDRDSDDDPERGSVIIDDRV